MTKTLALIHTGSFHPPTFNKLCEAIMPDVEVFHIVDESLLNNTIAATNSLLQSCANYAPQLTDADRTDFVDALQVVIRRNDHLGGFVRDFARVVRLPQPELTPTDLAALI